jgi:NTE family protein
LLVNNRIKALSNIDRLVRSVRAFSREYYRPSPKPPIDVAPASRPLKLGLALGGGFARGILHIGVLKALEQAKIPVDFVAGTSVGALVGSFYCAGMSAAEMEEVARTARFKDFARWTLSRYGLCSTDRMTHFCAQVLKTKTFEELKIPFAVTATDFRTGEAVVFTKGSLVDSIRASCAYPGMFPPVEIDGRSYIDGMLAYAVPTTPLRHMGAESVLGVYLSAHWSWEREPRHLFEVIGQCFSIAQSKMTEMWKKDADLVIEPDVAGFAFDCFDRAPELIALGEASMRAVLPKLKILLNMSVGTAPSAATDLTATPPPLVRSAEPQPSSAA